MEKVKNGYDYIIRGGDFMTTNMTIRIDSDVRNQMNDICSKLGMTTSTAINLFINAFVREKGMPFPISLKNDNKTIVETINRAQMLKDADEILNQFASDYERMAK